MYSTHEKAAALLLGKVLRRGAGLACTFYTKPDGVSYRGGYVCRDGTWDYLDSDAILTTPEEVRAFIASMVRGDDSLAEDLCNAAHLNIDDRHDIAVYTVGEINLVSMAFFHGTGADRQLLAGYADGMTAARYVQIRCSTWAKDTASDEKPCLLYSWQHVLTLIRSAEDKKYLSAPWKEITEEVWDEMLDVLPPAKWQSVNGVNMFYISEAQTSNIHQHYARRCGRYFTKLARSSTSYELLSREVIAFCTENPRKVEEVLV